MGQDIVTTTQQEDQFLVRARYLKSIYRTDEAIAALKQAISNTDSLEGPGAEALFSELADCNFISGDYVSAFDAYKILGDRFPDRLMYQVRQMQCSYKVKDYASSVEIGERIIARDTIPAVAALIGDAYNQAGLQDSALVWYTTAISRKPVRSGTRFIALVSCPYLPGQH